MARTMGSMRTVICVSVAMLGGMLLPAVAWAQASGIAGVVKDTTGAVLPGVTVEATSPALIEKLRTVVTDEQGQYKIVDLRPGTYSVTFTLPGFSTVKRDGIELTTDFTATVNADLKVGSLEETITVSGQTPMVDIQNVVQQRVVTTAVLQSLPNAKSIQSMAALIPGLQAGTNQDVGGTNGDAPVGMAIHGGRAGDQHIFYDSMRTNNLNALGGGGGGSQTIWLNPASIQEISIGVGNLSIESEAGGIVINVIPKDGGNTFKAFFLANGTTSGLQSSNLTANLRARGVTSVTTIRNIFDANAALGGPLVKDKLWFHSAHRRWGNENYVAGDYFNATPLAWTYTPDLSRQALDQNLHKSNNVRFTWQVNQKNKITFAVERQYQCLCYTGVPGSWSPMNATPEAATFIRNLSAYEQLRWTDAISNKLLLEAGGSFNSANWEGFPQSGVGRNTTSVTELTMNRIYRAASLYSAIHPRSSFGNFVVSYVTGSHAVRVGTMVLNGRPTAPRYVNGDMTYQFLNGVPRAVILRATPQLNANFLKADVGIYAQDQWTIHRLTLNLGLRHQYLNAYVPAQHAGAGTFVPARDYPKVPRVVVWNDLMPRLGIAYDLFGNGKTALKMSLNKYMNGEAAGIASAGNPQNTVVDTASRAWTDFNGDYIPDCDLLNPEPNGECTGPLSDRRFGQTSTASTTYDPAYLHGFGKRGYNWEVSAGVQHELWPGVSVNATYFHRWYGNYVITDNRAVSPSDYDSYCVTAPVDARLPGGGGNQICGFYDINPAKFGQINNFVTFASNYGHISDVYNGVDLTINARLAHGAMLQGGLNTGHEVTDMCDVIGKVDDPAATLPVTVTSFPWTGLGLASLSGLASPNKLYCHIAPPFQADVKLSGSYPLPWWNIDVSATLQSIPGPPIVATYVVPNAQIAPSLGRNLAAGANATATVQLVAPGTLFGDRLNQVDLRVTKTVKLNRTSIKGIVDLYNLFNTSPGLALNTRYGPSWQQPFLILQGRFVKFGIQVDY